MGGRSIPPDDEDVDQGCQSKSPDEWWCELNSDHDGPHKALRWMDACNQVEWPNDERVESQEQRATSASGGQKGLKPEAYALIPTYPLAELARVYGYGAAKYDDNNWRRGYPYSWSLSALMRHIEAFRSGVSVDSESGRHHLAHAAFHLFTLMWFDMNGQGEDDRADAA